MVPLVRRLMADHPWIDARLLIGDERISDNPKLNNVFKGWRETAYPFVSICDSNVLLPRDYVQSLLARFEPDTGLVCSPPIGCRPDGFWAEIECALLNTYQARWQYFADFLGSASRRARRCSGASATSKMPAASACWAAESAEDAACTKIVRELGLRVRLMQPPVRQPLGARARDRCLEAPAALGAAAACELSGLFRARNLVRLDAAAGRRRSRLHGWCRRR